MNSSEQKLRLLSDSFRTLKSQDIAASMPSTTGATVADFANLLEDAADEIAMYRKQLGLSPNGLQSPYPPETP
jgi:hypothetical protein